jgi:hypothetical protein
MMTGIIKARMTLQYDNMVKMMTGQVTKTAAINEMRSTRRNEMIELDTWKHGKCHSTTMSEINSCDCEQQRACVEA